MSAAIAPSYDCLQDEIDRLRALVINPVCLKRRLGLQPFQERVLRHLIATYPRKISAEELYNALSGREHFPSNTIEATMCRMRKLLDAHGMEIKCTYRHGYVLTAESHARLLHIIGVRA